MKMGELNVEIEICCRAEFITYACEILRKSVKVFCRFLNFFTERGEKRVSGFQSRSFFSTMLIQFFLFLSELSHFLKICTLILLSDYNLEFFAYKLYIFVIDK